MTTDRVLWVILSPVCKPAPGGGAIYNDILARGLADAGEQVLVIAEKFPGMPVRETLDTETGEVIIRRWFPYRAGRPARDMRSYVAYGMQTVQMLAVPEMIRRHCRARDLDRAIVLVHSSFFYQPSLLPKLLGRLKKSAGEVTLVLDVRDRMFSNKHLKIFRRFDAALGCSVETAKRLATALAGSVSVDHIPIPFSPPKQPLPARVSATLAKYDLHGTRYILNPNGIADFKGYPLMVKTIRALRNFGGYEDIKLLTIGRSRNWRSEYAAADRAGVLRYIGSVTHEEALCLTSAAVMTMVISKHESPSRAALEAITVGQNVLLPDLPEFTPTMAANVAYSDDPEILAGQIFELTNRKTVMRYPMERHDIRNLITLYRNLVG